MGYLLETGVRPSLTVEPVEKPADMVGCWGWWLVHKSPFWWGLGCNLGLN
jgi:hypothetical protein